MIHWLQHCGSWFGFSEPVRFVQDAGGGYFVSVASGEPVHSMTCNGFMNPSRGIAPWALREESVDVAIQA
jgi:hypothetical protein